MMESPLLELHLRNLHLSAVLANSRRLLAEHAEPLPYLSDLISLAAAKRQANGVRARIAAAHFPTIKTIESFDFSLQPELPKAKLLEHFDGVFVEGRRNLILRGPPGFGKVTSLASPSREFRSTVSSLASDQALIFIDFRVYICKVGWRSGCWIVQ